MTKHYTRHKHGILLAAFIVAAASPSAAGDCCKDKKSTGTATLSQGLQIHLGPNGERLSVPSKDSAVLPAELVSKNRALPAATRTASGGLRIKGHQFGAASVATINSEGKVEVNCITGVELPQEVK